MRFGICGLMFAEGELFAQSCVRVAYVRERHNKQASVHASLQPPIPPFLHTPPHPHPPTRGHTLVCRPAYMHTCAYMMRTCIHSAYAYIHLHLHLHLHIHIHIHRHTYTYIHNAHLPARPTDCFVHKYVIPSHDY